LNKAAGDTGSNDNFNETEILGTGPEINSPVYDLFIREYLQILPETEIVVVSGSLPPGCPPDLYLNLLNIALEKNKPFFIDCTDEPFRLISGNYCEGIHLNFKEFNELFSADKPSLAARSLSSKCRYAAITDGKEGLYLASENTLIHAHLNLEKIHSAVGSGDCLFAGLIAGYRRGYSLSEMARLGVACGAAKCINDELGLIHKKDVLDLVHRVNIEIIEG
jgi:fructose-1-phosphate kinase PfkB-like protein